MSSEESREDDGKEDDGEAEPALLKGVQREGESLSKPSAPSLYPSWKRTCSDSEFSDSEANAQSKLRYRETLSPMFVHVTAGSFFCFFVTSMHVKG